MVPWTSIPLHRQCPSEGCFLHCLFSSSGLTLRISNHSNRKSMSSKTNGLDRSVVLLVFEHEDDRLTGLFFGLHTDQPARAVSPRSATRCEKERMAFSEPWLLLKDWWGESSSLIRIGPSENLGQQSGLSKC